MSIYRRNNKYVVRFGFNGQRIFRTSPDSTQAGAKAYEAMLRQKLARGESLNFCEEKKDIPKFRDFSEKWVNVYARNNNKKSEVANKECILKAHLVPYFGNKHLDEIISFDVENFKDKKLKTGLSPKTINNLLIVLSTCLRTAQEWEVIKTVPKIKHLKVPPQKIDFLTESESKLLLENCDGLLKEMVFFALKTGLRLGELMALEWNDINFSSNLLTVSKSISMGEVVSTKSNKIRYIKLIDEIHQILLPRLQKSGFIFSNDSNKPLNKVTCLRWLHIACYKAGLRKIGWHTLRHSFASFLAQEGISMTIVQKLLGHADIKTTMCYSHLTPSATDEAIRVLSGNTGCNRGADNNQDTKNIFTNLFENVKTS
jgi:integrase